MKNQLDFIETQYEYNADKDITYIMSKSKKYLSHEDQLRLQLFKNKFKFKKTKSNYDNKGKIYKQLIPEDQFNILLEQIVKVYPVDDCAVTLYSYDEYINDYREYKFGVQDVANIMRYADIRSRNLLRMDYDNRDFWKECMGIDNITNEKVDKSERKNVKRKHKYFKEIMDKQINDGYIDMQSIPKKYRKSFYTMAEYIKQQNMKLKLKRSISIPMLLHISANNYNLLPYYEDGVLMIKNEYELINNLNRDKRWNEYRKENPIDEEEEAYLNHDDFLDEQIEKSQDDFYELDDEEDDEFDEKLNSLGSNIVDMIMSGNVNTDSIAELREKMTDVIKEEPSEEVKWRLDLCSKFETGKESRIFMSFVQNQDKFKELIMNKDIDEFKELVLFNNKQFLRYMKYIMGLRDKIEKEVRKEAIDFLFSIGKNLQKEGIHMFVYDEDCEEDYDKEERKWFVDSLVNTNSLKIGAGWLGEEIEVPYHSYKDMKKEYKSKGKKGKKKMSGFIPDSDDLFEEPNVMISTLHTN